MLKIGDFSKLGQVTIKALRLYDQMGLLKPIHVDDFTGYRYYSAEQLPQLNRILAFKDLGFSLDQIAKLLNDNPSLTEMRGMLRIKQAELERSLMEEQLRLFRVAARLEQIEMEEKMPDYEVVIKNITPITVASIRELIPNFQALPQLYDDLFAYIASQSVIPGSYCAGIWHDLAFKEQDIDWEVAVSFQGSLSASERVKIHELPEVPTMACTIHHGSYNTSNRAYKAVLTWIEKNQFRVAGPNREVYIIGGNNQDDESYVTEIQFPVIGGES